MGALGYSHSLLEFSVEKVWLLGLTIMAVHLRDLTGETQGELFENCIKRIKEKKYRDQKEI